MMPFTSELPISYEGLFALALVVLVMSVRRWVKRKGLGEPPIDLLENELRCGVITIPPGTKFGNS